MITPEGIDAAAEVLEISVPNVERDYVFGWLIFGIFQETTLGQSLVLKDDNALRKRYLPQPCFSDDLDFSTPDSLDRDQLIA